MQQNRRVMWIRVNSIAWTPASTTSPLLQASTSLLIASPGGPIPSLLLLLLEVLCSVDYCFSWRSHAQSTIASPEGPIPSRLELAPLQSARANEETAGAQAAGSRVRLRGISKIAVGAVLPASQIHSPCPLKRDSHTYPGTITDLASPSQRAHSRGTSALAFALLTVHLSCPFKRHISTRLCTTNSDSSCPLKRHISTRLSTTNSALIMPTQEAHQHSPLHY